MKNILISATQPQRFKAQLSFAQKVATETEQFNFYFFVSDEVYFLYNDIIDQLNLRVVNQPKKNTTIKTGFHRLAKDLIKKLINEKQRINLRFIFNFIKTTIFYSRRLEAQEKIFLHQLEKRYEELYKLVKEYRVDILLINGDRHLGYEPAFLKISKKLGIPSIIVYMVFYANEESIMNRGSITKKIKTNLLTSGYIKRSQDSPGYKVVKDSYYYSHPVANALKKFGVLTPNPYVMGSGCCDILCLDNQQWKDFYTKCGVDQKKLKVIGDVVYDTLYDRCERRELVKLDIINRYELDSGKKILIIALPQLAEHNILSWERHWEEINFLMQKLSILNQNILVSLHPKMERERYQFLEVDYNCSILYETLAEVLPAADLFSATFSSTVSWSVLCGIRTVVFDFYDLNLTMYDYLTSIKKVTKKDDFGDSLIETLNANVDFKKDWKCLSRKEVFDGKTISRYIKLMNEISVG